MSELLYVPERNLIPVPASMPLLHAAMVEPAAVALTIPQSPVLKSRPS